MREGEGRGSGRKRKKRGKEEEERREKRKEEGKQAFSGMFSRRATDMVDKWLGLAHSALPYLKDRRAGPVCPQFLPGLLFYKHKAFRECALFHVVVTFCALSHCNCAHRCRENPSHLAIPTGLLPSLGLTCHLSVNTCFSLRLNLEA